jgi:acyl phosphate:glycerol-3-phosphate acyltransferase
MLPLLLALVIGYLLGSLPFGYLVARAKGVNIFEVGSKNPGATNVRRVLGSGPGNLVFFLDALKGALATGLPLAMKWYQGADCECSLDEVQRFAVAGLFGALLGHSFSCFTKFKGGKGVATATGGFLVLVTFPVLIAAVVWFATFFVTRYVSLASIFAAITVPVAAYFFHSPPLVLGLTVLIGVFVVVRHRTNIQRLLNGTESKFVKKSDRPVSADKTEPPKK